MSIPETVNHYLHKDVKPQTCLKHGFFIMSEKVGLRDETGHLTIRQQAH